MHRILQLTRLSPPCPFADCWLFSIPGDKEKPAPAKYIIAGAGKNYDEILHFNLEYGFVYFS